MRAGTGASSIREIEMLNGRRVYWIVSLAATLLLDGVLVSAQPHPVTPSVAPPPAPLLNDKDVASTQTELIRLLRLSPTLTTVVSHDPSLLANHEYVAKNNPQLAAFLTAHPEVARNPEYYLFSHLPHEPGGSDDALERAVWPDVYRVQNNASQFQEFTHDLGPLLAFLGFLFALFWMIRMLVENRRWGKVFKLQSDVHGRLIDKFSTNQELAAYMETDAGRRFLEAAPIAVNLDKNPRVPNAVARVLTPLQIGIVMVLLGTGFLLLRQAGPDLDEPMLIFGTIVLMPGIGFILSAGISWLLAVRLGLMPPNAATNGYRDAPNGSKQ
jgi:hypothetical protein